MRRAGWVFAAAVAVLEVARLLAMPVPFWGARDSDPADTDLTKLKPGHFIWNAQVAPRGPIVMVVSLSEQRADVYRNGVRIGVTTVSTGKPGHVTPTGVFTILNKDKDHRSKTYDNAPMPYSERLTWDGVALHAGGLPGYPESHGCVHLPSRFAELLFGETQVGMTVVIASDTTAPRQVAHPAFLAPVAVASGTPLENERLPSAEDSRWQPDASPAGPVTVVVSGADRRILVLRNAVEIGRARITIGEPEKPLGTEAFVLSDTGAQGGLHKVSPAGYQWLGIPLPGSAGIAMDLKNPERVAIPPEFVKQVFAVLEPGATLYVTDAPIREDTTGPSLNVLNSDPPPTTPKPQP
jgi:L,D-transpeptidase catalytic domain